MDFIAGIILVLAAALIGRFLSRILRQPVILGELVIGAVIGNIYLIINKEMLTLGESIDNITNVDLRTG